jgi:c-di-GMP-binding flagellar brake protein YcgR
MKSQERRQQQRFSLNLQVKITAETETGECLFHEETIAANISSGGAFILTNRKLPIAGTVQLEFLLALEDLQKLRFILSVESLRNCKGKHVWVRATGVVIRVEDKGVGIIFDTDYQISPLQPSNNEHHIPAS